MAGSTAALFAVDEGNQVPALGAAPSVTKATDSIIGWST
jgi:hypothetical protein